MLNEDMLSPEANEEMEPEMDGEMSPDALKTMAGGIPKNFRQQADMEAFYRFVHENDLREEALTILDEVRNQKKTLKIAKSKVKH